MADNSVTVIGNITRDPELRFTPAGRPLTFGLAVNRRCQQNGEWEEQTCFFNIVALGPAGRERERVAAARAPASIVTGRLEQRSWETQDGEKRT